jgi:hypothetical protein
VPISSARAALKPLTGYMIGRYSATTSFNLVRIQDATRLHFSRLDEANDPTFCCPLLFALGCLLHHLCITVE